MNNELIYLDNAAATRLDERVMEAMKPFLFDTYAVATSQFGYSPGLEAREALEQSRGVVAETVKATADEIVFTSGGTESSNMAIKGVARALASVKDRHLITSQVEDFGVLDSMRFLERNGYKVDYISVDEHGLLDLDELENAIRPETALVSIQHANQEIGTLQNLEAIGAICQQNGVTFHSDATHSFTRVPIDVNNIPVDLLSLEASTIHGPKGVGALYIRKGTKLTKWMSGGYQEDNRRGGTENIPGAVGFARAIQLVAEDENQELEQMRNLFIEGLLSIEHSQLNGHPNKRLPQNANISFRFVEGESILLHLDMRNIAVSTGSACFSRSLEASHVMMAIGGDHERAHGSVRITVSRYNSKDQVPVVVEALKNIVSRLREISPLGKHGDID
ncbi:MAG: cysteine desulfurase family protein [Chloroflexota bacterium]